MDVHWGLVAGILGCIFAWVLIEKTTWGFSARISGGNVRAALLQGLPVKRLVIGFTALGGAFAGLAGMFEVAAIQGNANASIAAGYGYSGHPDRVPGAAESARHHPLRDPARRQSRPRTA